MFFLCHILEEYHVTSCLQDYDKIQLPYFVKIGIIHENHHRFRLDCG